MRKYKVTKWVKQTVTVGYETVLDADFDEYSGDGDWESEAVKRAEEKGHWDKIHDEVVKVNTTEYDVVSGYIVTPFEWTDELVAEFALESTRGSHGLYSGCETREEKLERFKDLKTTEFVPEYDKHLIRPPSGDRLGEDNEEEKCDRCGKVDDNSETYYIANNPEELLCKSCAVQP